MSIMRQNLALSASILLVLIPMAALGVIGLAAVVAVFTSSPSWSSSATG